jgi:hypothetical protein
VGRGDEKVIYIGIVENGRNAVRDLNSIPLSVPNFTRKLATNKKGEDLFEKSRKENDT